ncbi:hypothetical protein NL676_013240 [Syzygium grande]|nr:hypothetical protein NL676_013240 [Syzygium grande]
MLRIEVEVEVEPRGFLFRKGYDVWVVWLNRFVPSFVSSSAICDPSEAEALVEACLNEPTPLRYLTEKQRAIPKYGLIVEDGRRLANEYSRVLMRRHMARQTVESNLLRMKKEAIEGARRSRGEANIGAIFDTFPCKPLHGNTHAAN